MLPTFAFTCSGCCCCLCWKESHFTSSQRRITVQPRYAQGLLIPALMMRTRHAQSTGGVVQSVRRTCVRALQSGSWYYPRRELMRWWRRWAVLRAVSTVLARMVCECTSDACVLWHACALAMQIRLERIIKACSYETAAYVRLIQCAHKTGGLGSSTRNRCKRTEAVVRRCFTVFIINVVIVIVMGVEGFGACEHQRFNWICDRIYNIFRKYQKYK